MRQHEAHPLDHPLADRGVGVVQADAQALAVQDLRFDPVVDRPPQLHRPPAAGPYRCSKRTASSRFALGVHRDHPDSRLGIRTQQLVETEDGGAEDGEVEQRLASTSDGDRPSKAGSASATQRKTR